MATDTRKTSQQYAAKRFQSETANHAMTVLHDDGLYRHLRFAARSGYSYWFDLITWPGNLTINGDMGTFVFARVEDMFTFFRAKSGWNVKSINPQYWAEKIRGETKTEEYSEALFREAVADYVKDYGSGIRGLRKAVKEEILDSGDLYHEESARALLDEFEYDPGKGLVGGLKFRFTDTWELSFRDYSIFYLWCCHAIQWGIGEYDKSKSVSVLTRAEVTA